MLIRRSHSHSLIHTIVFFQKGHILWGSYLHPILTPKMYIHKGEQLSSNKTSHRNTVSRITSKVYYSVREKTESQGVLHLEAGASCQPLAAASLLAAAHAAHCTSKWSP